MIKTKELPAEIERYIDPETGYTVVKLENPEGSRLAESSYRRNATIRTPEEKVGMRAVYGSGGGYRKSVLPATHPRESHLENSS